MVHSRDHVEQCGFPCTRLANDTNEFSPAYLHADPFESSELTCCRGIHLYNIHQFDQG